MNRRTFLSATALGGAALPLETQAWAANRTGRGPALLTITGAIERGNRGPLNPALDQMMHKHAVKFDKAYAFDFAGIAALKTVSIQPTLEYDAKPHALSGPLLTDVMTAAGARLTDAGKVVLRAVDGYAVTASLADVRKYRFIVATHLDGQPMALGGLGPLWAVYDADRIADFSAKPLNQRFGLCPWALYHIDVLAA